MLVVAIYKNKGQKRGGADDTSSPSTQAPEENFPSSRIRIG